MPDRYDTNPNECELLPNKLGLTDQDAVNEEEATGFLRVEQAAIDALSTDTVFSLRYLYDLHQAAFGHLYEFAGRLRTVNMSKSGFIFPAAEFLPQAMEDFSREHLNPLNAGEWDNRAELLKHLAAMHAELLYLHPFREGNGRIVRLFTKLIFLARVGEELDFELLIKGDNFQRYVAAVQQAAREDYSLMEELFSEMHSRLD